MKAFLMVLAFASTSLAQKQLIQSYQMFCKFDENTFYVRDGKRKSLFWNNEPIDSSGLTISALTSDGRRILSYDWTPPNLFSFYSIDLNGQLKKLPKYNRQPLFLTGSRLFGAEDAGAEKRVPGKNIVEFDVETGFQSMFCRMDTLFSPTDPRELVDVTLLENGNYLVQLCDLTIETLYCQYFIVSPDGKNIKKIDFKSADNSDTYQLFLKDQDRESVLLEISGGSQTENGYFIYDTKFKPITRCLEGSRRIAGLNFKNNKLVSKNLHSSLDDGTKIIHTYQYSLYLERSLYRIYANEPLLEEDLRRCSAHDLDLIRNMVFAKHNYRFNSEFYQAYFNGYKFYWQSQFSGMENERKPRAENVDSLLTDIDRKNLVAVKTFTDKN